MFKYENSLLPSKLQLCCCCFPTVPCCWTQSWGRSGLSLWRPEPATLSAWSKTATRPASPRWANSRGSDTASRLLSQWMSGSHPLMFLLLLTAPTVRLSWVQPRLRRPSGTGAAGDPERSLEGGHQSPQPSGMLAQSVCCAEVVFWHTDILGFSSCTFCSCFQDYINCAEIWVEFTCRHFTVRKRQKRHLALLLGGPHFPWIHWFHFVRPSCKDPLRGFLLLSTFTTVKEPSSSCSSLLVLLLPQVKDTHTVVLQHSK